MEALKEDCPVVLQTGFRIFFLGSAVYAVASMAVWLWFYVAGGNIFVAMPLTVWHGHEMVFGFSMAVVAGFLLTAVMNWTGKQTLNGRPLLALFLLWAAARVLAFMPANFPIWPMAMFDTAFLIFLTFAVMQPIVAAKQWKQSAVFSKLILILISGVFFYGALLSGDLSGERKALRFVTYMLISLILTIGRRIMPFFIERGVGYPVTLRNNAFLDIFSLILLVAFSILDVFFYLPKVVAVICLLLAVIHAVRLWGWHTPGIWKKPLLWILFIGYIFLIGGFLLKFLAAWMHRPDDSALHAFTAGGIGIFTLGMMARVSWGHTGRSIAEAPAGLPLIFVPIALGAVIRTFFPIISQEYYILWIGVSQVLWMIAFSMYIIFYYKILTSPRADGKWG
jgi:uncharacterized protein involved in response to NO